MKIAVFFRCFFQWILIAAMLCLFGIAFAETAPSTNKTPITIKIIGLPKGDMLTNVQNQLSISAKQLGNNPSRLSVINLYHSSPKAIQQAMSPYGYFRPHIQSSIQMIGSRQWILQYTIEQGDPVMLITVDVSVTGAGANDPAFQALVKNFPSQPGAILNTVLYERGKSSLSDLAVKRGYFNALMVENKVSVNLLTEEARIHIHFETGDRFRFGKTQFDSTYFDPKFLERYLNYTPDEYYDATKISALQDHLSSSGYFNNINIHPGLNPDILKSQKPVPITIHLTPSPSRQYQIGSGYGTDTGIRGLAGLTMRHLTPTGDKFSTFLYASQAYKSNSINHYLVSNFDVPGKDPVTQQYEVGFGAGEQTLPQGTYNNFKTSLAYSTQMGMVKQTSSVTYLNENYNIPALFPGYLKAQDLISAINWTIRSADDTLNPTQGYFLGLKLAGTSTSMLSQNNIFQADFSAKYLRTFYYDYRMILRSEASATAINTLNDLPYSMQLFAGGANSVRGYGYQSLGPGRYLVVSSIELQRRIVGNWYLAGFWDAGSVSRNIQSQLQQGAGPGLLWLSPIGPVELTVAHALYNKQAHWMVQFAMGPTL